MNFCRSLGICSTGGPRIVESSEPHRSSIDMDRSRPSSSRRIPNNALESRCVISSPSRIGPVMRDRRGPKVFPPAIESVSVAVVDLRRSLATPRLPKELMEEQWLAPLYLRSVALRVLRSSMRIYQNAPVLCSDRDRINLVYDRNISPRELNEHRSRDGLVRNKRSKRYDRGQRSGISELAVMGEAKSSNSNWPTATRKRATRHPRSIPEHRRVRC